jgi:ribosomal protein S27AE
MKWEESILAEVQAHLVRLGLEKCPTCGSGTLAGDKRPVVLPIGGVPWGIKDADTNVLFMVRVECQMCGHSLLFNSERFHSGDTPTLER